jgi:hypothetical protein
MGEVHSGSEGPHWTVVPSKKKEKNKNNKNKKKMKKRIKPLDYHSDELTRNLDSITHRKKERRTRVQVLVFAMYTTE